MEVDIKLADICGFALQNKPLNITPGACEFNIYFNSDSKSVLNVITVTVINTRGTFQLDKTVVDQDKTP